jgi:AraC family transcriptional regulator of adaptative response / DNA-3-methyladenine glycosylase II
MLRFLRARAIDGLEVVTDDTYSRVIEIGKATGSVTVSHEPQRTALRVIVGFPELKSLPVIIARLRRMFDLSAEPRAIVAALSADPKLAPLVAARPGLRLPGGWDGFEIAVRAILGQQITVKAATHLATRIVAMLGDPVEQKSSTLGLTHAFPRPERFLEPQLARVGMPRFRASALANVAKAIAADPRLFDPRGDLDQSIAALRALPGVGEWTAHYIAMRALGESDAFMPTDIGVQRMLARNGRRPSALKALTRAQRWRPWRAYAVLHLWMAESNDSTTKPAKETDHALTA